MKLVSDLKYQVAGLLSGVDLNNVEDLNGCLERAASTLVQKADIPEASGIQNITLYSGVFDYLCDSRIFGTAINDIRPQGISRSPSNFVSKVNQQDFDRTKNMYYPSGTTSTFQFDNGVPIIRIMAPYPKQENIIDPMNSITGWVAGGSASALTLDTVDFYKSPASMRMTLTGNSVGTITKTLNSSDLSTYEGVGVVFLAIEIPSTATASDLSNISVKIGSDSSNYDSVTSASGFLGAWTSGNWLLVAFDLSGSTSTGTPDWTKIAYIQLGITHAASIVNFRVGGLWVSFPTPAQILYQSAAIFIPTGSTVAKTEITEDTDTIILTDPAYNIYLQEATLAVLQNTGAGASDAASIRIDQLLNGGANNAGLYAMYRGDNPSQEIRTSGTWYSNDAGYDNTFRPV